MKRLLTGIFIMLALSAGAQNNVLLDQNFWRNNPDLAAVKDAVSKGNNPAEANRMGFDAVVYAINAKAPTEVIIFLLDQKGMDVNKLTHDARTYLFWAASRGNVEVVEYLLSKAAKVNIEDSHGMTAISFAASAGQNNTKLYDALLKGGADIKQKNQDGASLLLQAVANDKDLTLTDYFVSKGLSLKDKDANGNTAFNYVARTGNIDLMKTLIQKGVSYTDNAFLMASQGGRGSANGMAVYEYLESLHLKATVVGSNGENVLHNLARKPGQEEIIRHFIALGVNAGQPDAEGNTPFMNAAASNRDTATIALFLSATKNINQPNKKGLTALTMAVRGNSADVVRYLLRNGANVNTTDADGNNLGYYLVQSYSANGGGGGFGGGGGDRGGNGGGQRPGGGGQRPGGDVFAEKIKALQDAGLNLATPQKDGNTLYHLAVMKNDLALLKKLDPLKLDVNAKNKEGLTALHKAAMISKDDAILKYLLSIGAKKDITTEFKETAFDLAKDNEYLTKTNVSVDFLKL